jgi:hypothetical protein
MAVADRLRLDRAIAQIVPVEEPRQRAQRDRRPAFDDRW